MSITETDDYADLLTCSTTADIPEKYLETPDSWDEDYRRIWKKLQIAEANSTRRYVIIQKLRAKLHECVCLPPSKEDWRPVLAQLVGVIEAQEKGTLHGVSDLTHRARALLSPTAPSKETPHDPFS